MRSVRVAALLFAVYGLFFSALGSVMCAYRVMGQTSAIGTTTNDLGSARYVGSLTCVQCHPREHKEWQTSQHAAAMQETNDKTVLGRFDGSTFSHGGVTSTFFKKDDRFWVNTAGADGQPADFEVSYTFGLFPLQQYLIGMPKGRLQALGIAWDARTKDDGGQRWFALYPDRKLTPGDPLHWTGIDQNWNYQCAFCHATNLKKNYDPLSDSFHTTWSELSIGCEACHGPASHHVAWASKTGDWQRFDNPSKGFAVSLDERKGVEWLMSPHGTAARSQVPRTSKEIEACATCHARRQQFSDDLPPGHRFLDAFRPALLEPSLYHVDGQQRDEVYNYASFLQSRMHAAGVTCSDCHNPHTLKLRVAGSAVCAQCHAPETFDTPSHHHHVSGSKGSECAACHMPTTTYMVVDPRHDHSLRVPRPDRTHVLGTPNACNQCHTDKAASWAAEAIKSWYPSPTPGYEGFAEAFDLADRAAPGAQVALTKIVEDNFASSIARASAIVRLGHFLSPKTLAVIAKALKDPDANVRMAAVGALAGSDPQTRLTLLAPLLADEARVVRMDAARGLAGEAEHLNSEDRKRFEAAVDEYIAGQRFNAERPEAQVNLASLYQARGKVDEAEATLLKAIQIDPTFVPAPVALSELHRAQGQESAAEATLRSALKQNPESAPLLHALGLSLVRQKRTEEAVDNLIKAAKLAPQAPRFAYVAGVALHDSGKPSEASEMLESALSDHPYDREILYALTTYEGQAGQLESALSRARLLHELEPEDQQVDQLLTTLRQSMRRGR